MIALTLSVPCADWLTPCENAVTTLSVGTEQIEEAHHLDGDRGRWRARWRRRRVRFHGHAQARGPKSRSCAFQSRAGRARHARRDAQAGRRTARCRSRSRVCNTRSASSAVAVRRGSIDNDLGAARPLVGDHALVEHRMAPGRVGADQHNQVGTIEILIAARHRVGPECAPMPRHRRGHTQARIGVDVGGTEKALHQLVGDVIVLGQQLAGEIERNRVRPVAIENALEFPGHPVECARPIHPRKAAVALAQHRVQQPARSGPACRPAPRPSSTSVRNSPDGRHRLKSSRRHGHPALPANRIRPRSRGRWCGPAAADARSCEPPSCGAHVTDKRRRAIARRSDDPGPSRQFREATTSSRFAASFSWTPDHAMALRATRSGVRAVRKRYSVTGK